jgi:hypothetical protein
VKAFGILRPEGLGHLVRVYRFALNVNRKRPLLLAARRRWGRFRFFLR